MFLEFLRKHHIEDKRLAVAVSGGADSLALILMMHEELAPLGYEMTALTVNHGLRPEAAEEASYVAEVMDKAGIPHDILVWEGDKPKTGVEEAARTARYELLREWCVSHHVNYLAVAHHQRDQAETFFMRLQRGSGLDGLCGMSPLTAFGGIYLLRPLLNVSQEYLKAYLKQKGIRWIEDPMNDSDDYLRVRVRKFLPLLEEKLGISVKRIADTMSVLAGTRAYLEEQTNRFIKNHVKFWGKAGVSVALSGLLQLPSELCYRVVSLLLKEIGGRIYPAESEEIQRLLGRLPDPDFKGCTLADCEVLSFQGKIWIVPEIKEKIIMPKKQWDDFTELHPQYKKGRIPHKMRLSLLKRTPI